MKGRDNTPRAVQDCHDLLAWMILHLDKFPRFRCLFSVVYKPENLRSANHNRNSSDETNNKQSFRLASALIPVAGVERFTNCSGVQVGVHGECVYATKEGLSPKRLAGRLLWLIFSSLFLFSPLLAAESLSCTAEPGQGPEMVVIPPGQFLMGSPESKASKNSEEGPQHVVTIQNAFALMRCEVTVEEFELFINETGYETDAEKRGECKGSELGKKQKANWITPGFEQGNKQPVVCVSWHDANAYAEWLSQRSGQDYRLPTEAEWEYAARAGTSRPFSTGDCIHTDQANYNGHSDFNNCGAKSGVYRQQTVPVEQLDAANPWGLRHMHGNVWEWTADCWHPDYGAAPVDGAFWLTNNGGNCERRVVRGGGWNFEPEFLRSAYRFWTKPDIAYFNQGFRLARTL